MAGSIEENGAAPVSVERLFSAARDLTDMTGSVNEFQMKNLKRWPLVAIQGSVPEGTTVKIAIGKSRSRPDKNGDMHRVPRKVSVTYDVQAKGRAGVSARGRAAAALAAWTRHMFWGSTSVRVIVNGREITPEKDSVLQK